MSKVIDAIDDELAGWIGRQHVFFVATAPSGPGGHVNVSPKGYDSFRVLGPHRVAYQDLTGSGAETIAHLRQNGRITVMFCAFEGPPRIVRFHGTGQPRFAGDDGFEDLAGRFEAATGTRAYVDIAVERISTSCGYAVPFLDYAGERDTLTRWADRKSPDQMSEYWAAKNARSIDDLPALPHREGLTLSVGDGSIPQRGSDPLGGP